jgi:hypothetical protein
VELTEITTRDFKLAHEYNARGAVPRVVMPRTGRLRQRCARCRAVLWFEGEAWDGLYCSAYCADPSRAKELWEAVDRVMRWEARYLCECRTGRRRRKIKYSTVEQAIQEIQRAQPTASAPLRVYACPRYEGIWHLTSQPA